jgi:ArsR family transcriptional regulator
MPVDVTPVATTPEARACCLPRRLSTADHARAEEVAELARVLSDPIRVQIAELLASNPGEVCQCDLQPLFAVSQPTLSHHLRKLDRAGLIEVERRGRWAYYSLRPETLEVLRRWLS